MIRPKALPPRQENLDRWLLTYADMITLLTIFFLLLYSMSVMSRGKFSTLAASMRSSLAADPSQKPNPVLQGGGKLLDGQGDAQNYEATMRNLNEYVEQHNLKDRVRVQQETRGTVISLLSDDMLFARGSADLQGSSDEVMRRVAQILQSAKSPVQVEGHTCDLPIQSAVFPSNWELSTARAGAVLRDFTARRGLDAKRFRAAGYADTQPLVPNINETNRAKNRRVDIVLMKTDAEREAEVLRRAEIRRILIKSPT